MSVFVLSMLYLLSLSMSMLARSSFNPIKTGIGNRFEYLQVKNVKALELEFSDFPQIYFDQFGMT